MTTIQRFLLAASCLITALLAIGTMSVNAQNYRQAGTDFAAYRKLTVVGDPKPAVAVAEFLHHGEINAEGTNLVVLSSKTHNPVPVRVLQLGPGVTSYDLYYGGEPPTDEIPQWSNQTGLLMETRAWHDCILNSVDTVRTAFEQSQRIGSGYVDQIHHATNPFALGRAPFLTRYSGTIRIPTSGKYAFYTTSQDCSFVLIDGQEVASAPGRHQPQRWALREMRRVITLKAGLHQLEYYHAAAGGDTRMVLAWEENPQGDKPAPQAVPSAVFRTDTIGKATVSGLSLPDSPNTADFLFQVSGDVPLPDNPEHLIGVQFRCSSPSGLIGGSEIRWDFGDGQTSDQMHPSHVYLKPGEYSVQLTLKRGQREHTVTNRVQVDTPIVTKKEQQHEIDAYLPILDTYDPAKLNAASLRQLVAAWLWKADRLLADADDRIAEIEAEAAEAAALRSAQAEEDPPQGNRGNRPQQPGRSNPAQPSRNPGQPPRNSQQPGSQPDQPKAPVNPQQLIASARQYQARAVDIGKTPFVGQSSATDEKALYGLAQLIAPVARDTLGDSPTAGKIWYGAAKRITQSDLAAHCYVEAADIALNDMLNVTAAKTMLDEARKKLGQVKYGATPAMLQRILGDYYAATGDRDAARTAYQNADLYRDSSMPLFERTAWQGAHSRSVEQFLKSGETGRAASELRLWQRDFPTDMQEGYINLLLARYWQQRKMYDQAVAMADRLLTINPASPYIDQLLVTASQCELARDRKDRALATLQGLVRDYPGSPMIPEVKQMIEEIEGDER